MKKLIVMFITLVFCGMLLWAGEHDLTLGDVSDTSDWAWDSIIDPAIFIPICTVRVCCCTIYIASPRLVIETLSVDYGDSIWVNPKYIQLLDKIYFLEARPECTERVERWLKIFEDAMNEVLREWKAGADSVTEGEPIDYEVAIKVYEIYKTIVERGKDAKQ